MVRGNGNVPPRGAPIRRRYARSGGGNWGGHEWRSLGGRRGHEVIAELPLYPEQRQCRRPTTEQVLRLFSLAQRHRLLRDGQTVQTFDADLTDLQRQVLALLGVPAHAYRVCA